MAALNKRDPKHVYSLMTEDEWIYLATSRGQAKHMPPWGEEKSALSEYAWLQDNKREAPYLPAPARGKKPSYVDGQPIWGLFGNTQQLVKASNTVFDVPRGGGGVCGGCGFVQTGPIPEDFGKLVGGYVHTKAEELMDPFNWIHANFNTAGSVRLIRRPRSRQVKPSRP